MGFTSWEDPDYFVTFADPQNRQRWNDTQVLARRRFRSHWCVLATNDDKPPMIGARDRDGSLVQIKIQTHFDEAVRDRIKKYCHVGNTVAIFYPPAFETKQPWTIDARNVAFLDLPMYKVIFMNQELVAWTDINQRNVKCHACGLSRRRINTIPCDKCNYFFYCTLYCQHLGWEEKRHKEYCEMLRDVNVQQMVRLDYSCLYPRLINFVPLPNGRELVYLQPANDAVREQPTQQPTEEVIEID
ncbi:hypothetical protein PG996_016077 [Apiospora saccharicola]|uniref:MYND-type domain-containing protein n=1 Tax=Apiospora saccharicola TaxID=335842 RepID=A0ABR1TMW2_9PEZI